MNKQTNKQDWLIVSILLLLAIAVSFVSDLQPFIAHLSSYDTRILLTAGREMTHGAVPYLDFFDHKGPLLFLIYYLGALIADAQGVWLFVILSLCGSAMISYFCARRFFSKQASFIGTAVFLIMFAVCFSENAPDLFALPFQFAGIYFLTKYFKDEAYELTKEDVFVAGLCMGAVLMLKFTLIGVWIGACGVIFIHSLMQKKYGLLVHYIVYFIAGIGVFATPFMLWLSIERALSEFWWCYVVMNMYYGGEYSIENHIRSIAYNVYSSPAIVVSLLASVFAVIERTQGKLDRNSATAFAIGEDASDRKNGALFPAGFPFKCALMLMLVTSVLIATGGQYFFDQYYYAILPACVMPLAWMADRILVRLNYKVMLAFVMVLVLMAGNVSSSYFRFMRRVAYSAEYSDSELAKLAEMAKEHNPEASPIFQIGGFSMYLATGFRPATYFLYANDIVLYEPGFYARYVTELREVKPKMVVDTTRQFYGIAEFEELLGEEYTEVFENGAGRLYLRNDYEID